MRFANLRGQHSDTRVNTEYVNEPRPHLNERDLKER